MCALVPAQDWFEENQAVGRRGPREVSASGPTGGDGSQKVSTDRKTPFVFGRDRCGRGPSLEPPRASISEGGGGGVGGGRAHRILKSHWLYRVLKP